VFLQPRRFNSSGTQLQKPKNLHYKNGLLLWGWNQRCSNA
jgi:hypothetical protein